MGVLEVKAVFGIVVRLVCRRNRSPLLCDGRCWHEKAANSRPELPEVNAISRQGVNALALGRKATRLQGFVSESGGLLLPVSWQ
jgi:hypothetical protein